MYVCRRRQLNSFGSITLLQSKQRILHTDVSPRRYIFALGDILLWGLLFRYPRCTGLSFAGPFRGRSDGTPSARDLRLGASDDKL